MNETGGNRRLLYPRIPAGSSGSGPAKLALALVGWFVIGLCPACQHPPQPIVPDVPEPRDRFEKVQEGALPSFSDDLDVASLRAAIEQSLGYYARIPEERGQAFGDRQVTTAHLKASLLELRRLLDAGFPNAATIASHFDVYRAQPAQPDKQPLVTGYYEPILDGRLKPDAHFQYPLYGLPPDLVTVDLSLFNPSKFVGETIVGRVQEGKLVPYHSREDIDGKGRLRGSGSELVWIKDPLDGSVLHTQGSGLIRLPNSQYRRLGYAGANGRPYKSLGKVLLERGAMSPESLSLQSIRSYVRQHPEQRDELLWQNESYVFFRWIQQGPLGSINVSLTGGRSIATDPKYHPRGGLAYLEGLKPVVDQNGEVTGYAPFKRWVLNQDTGGAIKGIGRVDLYCGTGEPAEWVAGRMKHPGILYFLVKKGLD